MMQPSDDNALNERAREILQWAIFTFVATGKPVGSRRIARKSREHLSAATVRNIMFDLEERGYLWQPHASAGRIPTDKAYRLYVDFMLGRHELSQRDRDIVDRNLMSDESPEQLMARTSQVLSRISNNLGIVVSPPITRVALQHIQFVHLAAKKILVVLVSRSGIVQDRVIYLDEDFSQAELDQAARFIVENYRDKNLVEIQALVLELIRKERAHSDRFMQRVIKLSTQTFEDSEEGAQSSIYLDGASNLIKNPEFSDINRMRTLFETIEEKSRLSSILTECIKRDTQEVRITIGAENALPGIEDYALITSLYTVDERTHGSLGILGPTRMEYGHAISLVEYVARLFGKVLGSQGN